MLLYNPETLVADVAGREPGLLAVSPILYLAVAAVSIGVVGVLAYRRSPYTVLAAAAAAVLASPKLFGYDVTTLAAVNPDPVHSTSEHDPAGLHTATVGATSARGT
jgi:hypothetical protein